MNAKVVIILKNQKNKMSEQILIFKDKNKRIDLPTFVDTRALICANSGGGKSYAIRKLLEQTHGYVNAIVLDIEGEFKTLREKFDFLLIGYDGDVELNIKSAPLLPQKLLELSVPTIIDISDLKRHDRVLYVRDFLNALMEIPRKSGLWKPCLIVLDEIHSLAGQQEKQESVYSVIDLATRGRKRGYCLVGCTQRISKLHKDVVAELNNTMIGRTGLDIDMKRAAEILGFTSKLDMLSLRDLDPGEFFVFGPAISKHVEKAMIGEVMTTHPKVGTRLDVELSQPTEKIKRILEKLSHLPGEAEKKKRELEDYKKEIFTLKKELRSVNLGKPDLDHKAYRDNVEQARKEGYRIAQKQYSEEVSTANRINKQLKRKFEQIGKIMEMKIEVPEIKPVIASRVYVKPEPIGTPYVYPQPGPNPGSIAETEHDNTFDEATVSYPKQGAMRMLAWLACFHPTPLTKQKLGTLSGFSQSGTFGSYVSVLKKRGWVSGGGNYLEITPEGMKNAVNIPEMPESPEELISMWASKFKAGAGKMLRKICDIYPQSISKEELGGSTGFIYSSGTFGSYLSKLRKNGLIKIEGQYIQAAEELFE